MTQPSDAKSFLDLANYVQAPAAPAVTAKQTQVQASSNAKAQAAQQASAIKQAALGSPEQQRAVATAYDIGIEAVAQDEFVNDLRSLDPLALAAKYGVEVSRNRYRYAEAEAALRNLKSQKRSDGDVVTDALAQAAGAAVGMVGSTVAGGAALYDAGERAATAFTNFVTGAAPGEGRAAPAPLSPQITEGKKDLSDFVKGGESQLSEERAAQHALEAALYSAENEAEYQAALEAAMQEEGGWERAVMPWLQKQGAEIADTVRNYADDPIMQAGLGAEAVGSLLPVTAGTAALGGGRKAATALMGMSESGAAVTQTIEEVLAMDEKALGASPDYVAMRNDGMSHEEARAQVASKLGGRAGAAALPLAVAAGYVAAPVAMNPLRTGGTGVGRVVGAGQNVARESVEEFIQEGNTQAMTNVALNTGGFDVALDRGVAQAATQGAMGGVMASGAMQAPGAVAGVVGNGLSLAGQALTAGIDARKDAQQRKRDDASSVGSKARAAAADRIEQAASQILPPAEPAPVVVEEGQTAPEQTEAAPRQLSQLEESVSRALYLDEVKAGEMVQAYPVLEEVRKASPNGLVRQSDVVDAAGSVLQDRKASPEDKMFAALDAMLAIDEMRRVDSDAVRAEVAQLPETDGKRIGFGLITEDLKTYEGSTIQGLAEEAIRAMTPETIEAIASNPSPEVPRILEVISRVNATVVPDATYDMALEQVGSGKQAEELKKKLAAAKEASRVFRETTEEKAKIRAEQEEVIEEAEKKGNKSARNSLYPTHDIVREEIATLGNSSNRLPSLMEHRRRVTDSAAVGRTEEAQEALTDLVRFAKSQVNKLSALNQSASNGKGKDGAVEFQAFNGGDFFKQKGVWFSASNPFSVAQARDVAADTKATVALAQSLAQAYGLKLTEDLTVPALHPRIASASITKPKQTAAPQTTSNQPAADEVPLGTVPSGELTAEQIAEIEADVVDPVFSQDPGIPRRDAVVKREESLIDNDEGKPAAELEKKKAARAEARRKAERLASLRSVLRFAEEELAGLQEEGNLEEIEAKQYQVNFLKREIEEIVSRGSNTPVTATAPSATPAAAAPAPVVASQPAVTENETEQARKDVLLDLEFAMDDALEAGERGNFGGYSVQPEDRRIVMEAAEAALNGENAAPKQDGRQAQGIANVAFEIAKARASDRGILPNAAPNQTTPEQTTEQVTAQVTEQVPAKVEDNQTQTPAQTQNQSSNEVELTGDTEVATRTDAVTPWFNALKQILPTDKEGRNLLTTVFRPKANATSLPAHESPAQYVRENLDQLVRPDNSLKEELTSEEQEALSDHIDVTLPSFVKSFERNFARMVIKRTRDDKRRNEEAVNDKTDRPSWVKMALDGIIEDVLGWDTGRVMNTIVNEDGGRPRVEPRIMEATFMAATEWMIQNAGRIQPQMDKERVAKLFGMNRSGQPSGEMYAQAQFGVPLQSAIEAIARGIQDLVGLESNPDAPVDQTQGMFRALAANALEVMLANGALEEQALDYKIKDPDTKKLKPRKMISVRVSKPVSEDSSVKNLKRLGSPFSKIFLPGFEKERLIGEPARDVNPNQLGNKFAKISDKAARVINRLQKMPNKVNRPMVEMLDLLGDDLFKDLLGFKPITTAMEERTNKVDLIKIKGKNASIERGITETRAYVEEAGDRPIFFRWRLSSVGRLQQEGPITPQGDKIAREIIAATNSVLDLANPDHMKALWLAVAQSSDISVEKMSHDEAIAKAKDLYAGALAPAVQLLRSYIVDGDVDQEQFRAEFKAVMDASGETVTPKLLHALMTVARAEEAIGTESFNSFETALALEADGKTDGPINAMVHMGTKDFTREEFEVYAKGGLFFTSQPTSLNQFIELEHARHKGTATEKPKAEDLYHLASGRLKEMLSGVMRAQMPETMRVMRALDALLDGFTLGEQQKDGSYDPQITRNVVKNPLTVFLYGSGDNGIANKIAGQMVDQLYKVMSEIAAGQKDGKFRSYRDHPLFKTHPDLVEDLSWLMNEPGIGQLLTSPVDMELSQDQFNALAASVLEHFADPMLKAVDEVTGGLAENMKLTQKASQIQTLIYQELYRQQLLEQEKAAKEGGNPAGMPGSKLMSQAGLDESLISMMSFAPNFESEDQSFQIAAPEKETIDRNISQSFGGRLKSRATYIRPSDASVKFSPFVTIGTGDGQMMLNIYATMIEALDRSLAVFDGVEQALDNIKETSQAINKAVWEGWMGSNVYAIASQGYSQMTARMNEDLWARIPDDVKREIGRAAGLKKGTLASLKTVNHFQGELDRLAGLAQDRKEALKQLATQVDHMAGAEAQHSNEGLTTESNDPQDYDALVDLANALQDEARAKREAAAEEKANTPKVAGYAQAPNQALKDAIEKVGTRLGGFPGVVQVRGEALLRLLSDKTGMTPDQQSLLRKVLAGDGPFKQTVYFFGSSEELAAARAYHFPSLAKKEIQLGLTDVGANVAWISNTAPETILHEMLHTRTARLLDDHYAGRETPAHVPIAVQQLEGLMGEVLNLVPDTVALATLHDQLTRNDLSQAEKISELISYVLTNPDLTEKTKTQNTYQSLSRIIKAGYAMLKKLLGLSNRDFPDNKIWNQVRFSTEVLVRSPALSAETDTELALSQVYGADPRLERVERQFVDRLGMLLDARFQEMQVSSTATNLDEFYVRSEGARLRTQGRDAAERFTVGGFRLNARQKNTFGAVHAAFSAGIRFDASLLRQVNELHAHVLANLTPELLRAEGLVSADRAAKQAAFMTGSNGHKRTADGRSDLLASFMALAQTSPEFRAALDKMPVPKAAELKWGSVNEVVTSLSNMVMSLLTRLSLKKPERSGNIAKELDRLSDALTEVQSERRMISALGQLSKMTDKANEFASSYLESASKKAVPWLEQRQLQARTKVGRVGLNVAGYVASIGSKTESELKGDELTRMMNHVEGWDAVRSLLNDLRGATASNKELLRMINVVRAKVDALRQDSREKTPETLAEAFSRKLTREEWSQMHKTMGATDLMALGITEARALLADPASLVSRIAAEEEALQKGSAALADRYKAKARALATYMVERKVTSQNLLRNAHAIAHLFGEADRPKAQDVTDRTIERIERLTALYAFEMQPQETRDAMKALMETESQGMEMVTGMLASVRQMEKQKTLSDDPEKAAIALNNAWAGWLPTGANADTQVRVFDDKDHDAMRQKGWVRIGDYEGDANEDYRGRRGYYQSSVAGRAAFRQGIAQSVHSTFSGVNMLTGQSSDNMAGTLKGARVTRLARAVEAEIPGGLDGLDAKNYLLPIYSGKGEIVAYERSMDPAMLEGLQKDDHLGRMLGVWSGRIIEEQASHELNRGLITTLKTIYDRAVDAGETNQFTNVADPKHEDSVVVDAWETLGFQLKDDAAEIFGRPNFLPVRRDMVNDAMGYRAASLTDPWNDTTRAPEIVQKVFKELVTLIAGDKAYGLVRKGEKGVQELVSYAKTTIIVRSIIVGTGNILSNILHLAMSGVPIHKIGTVGRKKLIEIQAYVKNREEIGRLQIHYAAKIQDDAAAQKIATRIQALEDANAQLSIAPLIEAGEFSTISEGLDEADVALREGKLVEYMEKALDRMPKAAGTALKNIAITKDTEIFKGLNRMVQYGDFVAKAVLYDHLKEKGMGEQQVLDTIMEEFVQYNRLPGRGRDYLESMGLLWFMNYALRIQKISVKMMRERPLSALLMMGQVGPLAGIDSVMSGSLAGKYMDGSLGFSVGPQMGINSPSLHPLWNMTH